MHEVPVELPVKLLGCERQLHLVHQHLGGRYRGAAHHLGLDRPLEGFPVSVQDVLGAFCVEGLCICIRREGGRGTNY